MLSLRGLPGSTQRHQHPLMLPYFLVRVFIMWLLVFFLKIITCTYEEMFCHGFLFFVFNNEIFVSLCVLCNVDSLGFILDVLAFVLDRLLGYGAYLNRFSFAGRDVFMFLINDVASHSL